MKKLSSFVFAAALTLAMALSFGAPTTASACEGHGKGKAGAKKEEVKQLASASFKVEGMHCAGCGDKVKAALGNKDGIVAVDVKIADRVVAVQYDAAKLSPAAIAKMITDAGYKATAEV